MEDKEYENVCDRCSKIFITTDEDATLCNECWKEIVGENEGKDSNE